MTFEDFHLHPEIMQGIREMKYLDPTPVQEKAIPPILEGKDIIANAQTGSGKTAAFLLPLMHRVLGKPEGKTRILVLVPTRELACQIDDHALGFGYHTTVKCGAIYGGVRMERQEQWLKAGTAIIVATPGRLLDHDNYGNWRFDELDALVLDEADRMLDMGFWPDIQKILKKLPVKKQMLLFSATMPPPIVKLAKTMMTDPVRIEIGLVRPPSTIRQSLYPVQPHAKTRLVMSVLKEEDKKAVMVFVGTKIGTERLCYKLQDANFSVGMIHGDLEQTQRDKVIVDFKSGKIRILVATDVASRGIDISGVSHVINFDMPRDTDTYIHRIGRTARAQALGEALSFITPEDEEAVVELEKVLEKTLERKMAYACQKSDDRAPSNHKSHHGPHTRGKRRAPGFGGGHRGPRHHGGHHRRSGTGG